MALVLHGQEVCQVKWHGICKGNFNANRSGMVHALTRSVPIRVGMDIAWAIGVPRRAPGSWHVRCIGKIDAKFFGMVFACPELAHLLHGVNFLASEFWRQFFDASRF